MGGVSKALLLRVSKLKSLPDRLYALLSEPSYTFVGRAISGDLGNVGKDFNCSTVTSRVKSIDLGMYARERDVVSRGTAGLERLVFLTLGKQMSKAVDVRCSKWSAPQLSPEQIKYAAMDATYALDVYHKLSERFDVAARLGAAAAVPGVDADLVPTHGSVAVLASRVAAGSLLASPPRAEWISPFAGGQKVKVTKTRRLLQVTTVLAPSYIIKGITHDDGGSNVRLADFGPPPFTVVVPLTALAPHAPLSEARVWVDPDEVMEEDEPADAAGETGGEPAEQQIDREADEALEEGWEPTEQDVALLRAAAADGPPQPLPPAASKLDAPPDQIVNRFSSITGDAFHFQDRAKVPMHHEVKKAYHVALRDAWMIFDPVVLEEVKDVLRKNGFTEDDIDARMYYDFDYFRQRVPRRVPPPSVHYWRVRRVFELFGSIEDSKTKQPLFNDAAWRRANNVLLEILEGHAADAPGYVPYHQRLDSKGQPAVDQYSLALLDCSRGTSDTECAHKQIITAYGSWVAGVELSDVLLREWRHRYNHRIAERRRLGFPKIGHYDTWLIDELQLLVEANHGVDIYPGWSNTRDFAPTPETFGTVPLHSSELGEAMARIAVSKEVTAKLSGDQRYLCASMGTSLPLLPIHGKAEHALFSHLALAQLRGRCSTIDFDKLALTWCEHVDGTAIFPKLPVYLRQHYAAWQKSQRIKDTLKRIQPQLDALRATLARDAPTAVAPVPTTPATAVPIVATLVVAQHIALPLAPPAMAAARAEIQLSVAGMHIGGAAPEPAPRYVPNRKRGRDKRAEGEKRIRTCKRCCEGTDLATRQSCPGRSRKTYCVNI